MSKNKPILVIFFATIKVHGAFLVIFGEYSVSEVSDMHSFKNKALSETSLQNFSK